MWRGKRDISKGCQGWRGGGRVLVCENYGEVVEEMKFMVLMTNYGSFQWLEFINALPLCNGRLFKQK